MGSGSHAVQSCQEVAPVHAHLGWLHQQALLAGVDLGEPPSQGHQSCLGAQSLHYRCSVRFGQLTCKQYCCASAGTMAQKSMFPDCFADGRTPLGYLVVRP